MRQIFLIGSFLGSVLYAQNGTLKTDFGTSGKMSLDIDDLDDLVGFLKDDQENTLFYGNTSDNQGGIYPFDFFIGKMDAYGNLDPYFGNNGVSRHDFPGFQTSSINKAVIHSSGIYFLGQGSNDSSPDTFALFIGKMNFYGAIDTSFGNQGFYTSNFLGTYNTAGSLIIDSDDKIIFCGSTTDDQGTLVEYPFIGRLNLDGTQDSTFGGTGVNVFDYYHNTLINAMQIPQGPVRHGDGAYLSEILEYNNAYFVSGKFLGTSYTKLHMMSFAKDGNINPHFISSGLFAFQIDPGTNHYLYDIAYDGSKIYLAFETQGSYNGHHMIQVIDTSGVIGNLISISDPGYDMKTRFIEFWNDRLFIGGYHLDEYNTSPGYHSDDTRIYAYDTMMEPITSFLFTENMATGDEQGAEDIIFHDSYGIVGGYMNNVTGDNYTDLFFMCFEVDNELLIEEESLNIDIYPNPCSGVIYSRNEIGYFELLTLTGKQVMKGKALYQINLSDLAPGTYILRCNHSGHGTKIIVI